MSQPKYLPGAVVYLNYFGHGILIARVQDVVMLRSGEIEYHVEGNANTWHETDLHASLAEVPPDQQI